MEPSPVRWINTLIILFFAFMVVSVVLGLGIVCYVLVTH